MSGKKSFLAALLLSISAASAVADTTNLTYEVTIGEVGKDVDQLKSSEQFQLVSSYGKPSVYSKKETHTIIEKCSVSTTGKIDSQEGERITGTTFSITPQFVIPGGVMAEMTLDYSKLLNMSTYELNGCKVDLANIEALTVKRMIVVEKGKKIDFDQFKIGTHSYVVSIRLLN